MQLERLKILKNQLKGERAKSLIDPLVGFLQEQERKHVKTIVPEIVSKRLKIPFNDALYILGIVEEGKLLKRQYQVFSYNDHYPLGEYDSASKIPEKIYNPATEKYIDSESFFIDLVFQWV